MKNTKAKLISSVAVLLICFAMLIGSTFAWFTDSASTGVNKIQAGNLDIYAYYQNGVPTNEGTTVDYTVSDFNRNNHIMSFEAEPHALDGANVITETTWEPGKVGTKLITVENKGSLNATISLRIKLNDGGLASAMWYDFISVNGSQQGAFTERRMNSTVDGIEVLASSYTAELRPTEKVSFILAYGMDESAGNKYQDKSLEAFVTVLAKQAPVESDSFGSDYDVNATYDPTVWDGQPATEVPNVENGVVEIHTPGELAATLASIPSCTTEIRLMNDINLAGYPWGPYCIENHNDLTINGNGFAISGLNANTYDSVNNGGMPGSGLLSLVVNSTVKFKELTIKNSVSGFKNDGYVSASLFVGHAQSIGTGTLNLTFENCIVENSKVSGQGTSVYASALVGYVANNSGNANVSVKNCKVTNSTFDGNDATGALIALSNTAVTIDGANITGNTINGGAGYSAATLVGTSGGTTAHNVIANSNTFEIVGSNYQVENTTYGYIYKLNNTTYSVNGSELNS